MRKNWADLLRSLCGRIHGNKDWRVERLDPSNRLSPLARFETRDEVRYLVARKSPDFSTWQRLNKDLNRPMKPLTTIPDSILDPDTPGVFIGGPELKWTSFIVFKSDLEKRESVKGDPPRQAVQNEPGEISVPALGEKILFLGLSRSERDEQIGDLEEEFLTKVVPRFGPRFAKKWYWSQVSRTVCWAIVRRIAASVEWIFRLRRS